MRGVIQRRLTIHGLVQGVGFRWATRTEARRLGLAGWVRNRRDGTVEALFDGEEMAVQQIMRWCWHGPAGARVDHIDVELPDAHTEPAELPFAQHDTA